MDIFLDNYNIRFKKINNEYQIIKDIPDYEGYYKASSICPGKELVSL